MKLIQKPLPVRYILGLFLATRLLLLPITYFGYIFLTQGLDSSTPISINTLFDAWQRWDAPIYTRLAEVGYRDFDEFAFFPLYPLLISLFAFPLGSWSYFLVGVLISNAALLGVMFILYILAEEAAGEQVARRTLLYLCIFPTTFFFFTAYNESLFLLCTLGTFLALRRERWWLACFCAFLGVTTRSAGVVVAAPFLYELWLQRTTLLSDWRKLLWQRLAPLTLIPLALILICLFCWHRTGDPIAFATVQIGWSRQMSWPWHGIVQNIGELFYNQPFGSFNQVHVLIDLSATLGFIALAILGRKHMPREYTLWLALFLLYYLLSPSIYQHDALISNRRFVLEMFPAFITLAILGLRQPRLHQVLLWVFPILLAVFSMLFITNKWMV